MIQELKVSNFLSFKEEVTFNFEATRDTTFEEYQTIEVVPGVRLLRFAIVFGANASGKSNLISTFEFLRTFWFNIKKDITEETKAFPFKLDRETQGMPSSFSLKFYVNQVRYWYQLEIDEYSIHSEKLFYYSSVQPTLLFDRTLKNNVSVITFNQAAVKVSAVAKDEISIKCLPNMSFFAARNQVNVALPKIDDARDWMMQNVMDSINPETPLFEYAETRIQKNDNLKKHLLEFVKEADFNITDIKARIEKQDVPPEFLDYFLNSENTSEEEKVRLKAEKNVVLVRTDFEHTVKNKRGIEKYFLPDQFESEGTRRITGIQTAINEMLQNKALLPIDEIESSLHPSLIIYLLKKFLEIKDNRAQLLITTHYDPLLNEADELFRKDSVWFTEKNEAGATELYSLVEFSGLNRIASLQKAYRQGKFGAIPKINL